MKRFLHTVLAAAIALTPMMSQAQEYRFRYVTASGKKTTAPPVNEEFGVGNDIQAYFATVVGEEFSRRIPVATRDVVSWTREEGILPDGLDVGTQGGVIGVVNGKAEEASETESLWYGFDANGNRIAKARIFFEVIKPEGTMLSADYYAHTNQYFYEVLPMPEGIDVSRWEPIGLANVPDGMATRFGALEGLPEEAGLYDLLWQGYDYMDRKVAFLRGTLLVEDGPNVEEIADQFADKAAGEAFSVEPVVKNKIGTITYKLLPVDMRPTGLSFSSSTGKIDGVYEDYDTSAAFQIEVRDSADGTTGKSNIFTLTTGAAVISMADLRYLDGYIDEQQEWKLSSSTSANVKLTFTLTQGQLPDGLKLDKDTGVISGKPTKIETQTGLIITATAQDGTTDTAGPFDFQIKAQRLIAETTPLDERVNTPFTTKPIKVTSGIANPMTYTETVSDPTIIFDQTALTFSSTGLPLPGHFYQRLRIENGAGDYINTTQAINIYNVPQVSYDDGDGDDVLSVKLKKSLSVYPTVTNDSIRGTAYYTLKQGTLPDGFQMDRTTGRIYGYPKNKNVVSATPYGPFIVSITDAFNVPYDSAPFFMKVDDRDNIEWTATGNTELERYVGNGFKVAQVRKAYGDVVYRLDGNVPSTLSVNSWGYIVGTTSDPVGTVYSGLILHATDSEGYTAPFGPFDLTVVAPKNPPAVGGSYSRDFKWSEEQTFSFDMPKMSNPYGPETYTLGAGAPATVAIVDGKLEGVVDEPGIYPIAYTITDDLGRTANGTITLTIQEQMSLETEPVQTVYRGTNNPFAPTLHNGIGPFTYSWNNAYPLPDNMEFDPKTGTVFGKPTKEGDFPAMIHVADSTGDRTSTRLFTIRVEKPLPLSLEYKQQSIPVSVFTWVRPTLTSGSGDVTWTHVSGDLPSGMYFINAGSMAGTIYGTPEQIGVWKGITIDVTDNGTGERLAQPYVFDITITPNGDIAFAPGTIRQRVSATSVSTQLQAGNTLGQVEYEFHPNSLTYPGQLMLTADGKLLSSFTAAGHYDGILITAKDMDIPGRSITSAVAIDVVDKPTAIIDPSIAMNEFQTKDIPFILENVIGNATVSVIGANTPAWLSINGETLSGTPNTIGTIAGLQLHVVDDHDNASGDSNLFDIVVSEREALAADDTATFTGKQYQTATLDIPFQNAIGTVTLTSNPALPQDMIATVGEGNVHLEGTFDATYNGTFTLTLTDEKGGTRGTKTVGLTVQIDPRDALTADATAAFSAQQFETKSVDIPFQNAIGAVQVTAAPTLPDNLTATVVGNNLHLEGTFDTLLNDTFTLTLTDEKGGTKGTHTIALSVDIVPREQLTMDMTIDPVLGQQLASLSVKVATVHNELAPVELTTDPALPQGLVLGNDGVLSGIPDVLLAETVFTVHATDNLGGSRGEATGTFTLTVEPRAQLTMDMAVDPVIGKQYGDMQTIQVATVFEALGPVTLTVTPDLPDGLTLANNGLLSGKPTVSLPETVFTVHATDGLGGSRGEATGTFKLTVGPRDQLTLDMPQGPVTGKQYSETGLRAFTAHNEAAPLTVTITPDLPDELTLGSDGIITGKPTESMTETTYTVSVTDGLGGSRGEATGTFKLVIDVRDPLKLTMQNNAPAEFSFNQYFQGSFTLVQENAIDGHTFSTVTDLPPSLFFNPTTGEVSGTPTDKFDDNFTFRVTDGVGDRKDLTVHIKVDDRLAPVISAAAEQPALLGYDFGKTLETENVLGTTAWTHVSGTLPDGIQFDPAEGRFHGNPTQFGTFDNIVIGMTDTYEGATTPAVNKTFKIVVQQDGSPITLTGADAMARVDAVITVDGPVAANTVGDATITVSGLNGTGLAYNAKTGKITGTPMAVGPITAVFTASDVTGRSESFTMTIDVKAKLTISMTLEQDALFNYSLADAAFQQPQAGNVQGTAVWSVVDETKLPNGVTVDPATGAFLGAPLDIGAFGPIQITVADDLPGTTTSGPIWITVMMNEDPILLTVTNIMSKVGYPFATSVPVYANTLGGVSFYSLDLAGTNLQVDPLTGVMTGSFGTPQDRNINLSIKDETWRVTSKPIRLQILPKMVLFAAATTRVNAQEPTAPIKVTRQNVVGDAIWHPVDPTMLPEGMVFNTATGQIEGEAQDIGTFGPFQVTSTDSLGDTGTSNPITIISQPGSLFVNLLASPLADAVKRFGYSFDFRTLVDPRSVGVDVSELAWSLSGATPPGLHIDPATGILDGTPSLSGQYDFRVNASFGGKTWGRDYSLKVVLPDASLDLVADADGITPTATRFVTGEDHTFAMDYSQFLTLKNIPADEVQWTMEPFAQGERLPQDLTLDGATGVISGTARSTEGTYNFRLTARYKNGTDEDYFKTVAYSIRVNDTLKFTLDAAAQPLSALKRVQFAHDFGEYVKALPAAHKPRLAFSWSAIQVDEQGAPITPAVASLSGLSFSGSQLRGISPVSGSFNVTVTASVDNRTATNTYRINVGLQNIDLALNAGTLPDGQTRIDYAFDFKTLATPTNIPMNQVRWSSTTNVTLQNGEIAGLPLGLTLDPTTGVLSGSPTDSANYRFEVKAAWKDDNPTAESVSRSVVYTIKTASAFRYTQISAGDTFACGVTPKGALHCWGSGYGNSPTVISELGEDVASVATGFTQSSKGQFCVVTKSGAAKCYGSNSKGQFGTGGTSNVVKLWDVQGLQSGVAEIGVGDRHGCALLTTGEVKCWGVSTFGQVGTGDTATSLSPITVPGLENGVQSIQVASMATCALKTNKEVWCWGQSYVNGSSTTNVLSPAKAGVGFASEKLRASNMNGCAFNSNGQIACWGIGGSKRLQKDNTYNNQNPSLMSASGIGNTDISIGGTHMCSVKSGKVYCWGNAEYGKLGAMSSQDQPSPVLVRNITTATSVAAGGTFTCALLANGQANCWGNNSNGELGNWTNTNAYDPVAVGDQ